MDDECNATLKETFQEPRKRFWLRSRKRLKSDTRSVSSMDISMESDMGKRKKRRRITEVASSIFSSSTVASKSGNTLHRSFIIQPNSSDLSIVEVDESDTRTLRKNVNNATESCNNLAIRSWMSDIAQPRGKERFSSLLSRNEIRRQEAIYELYCGETVLLNELHMLRSFYYEPMSTAEIFTCEELATIFGNLANLVEIHSNLRDELFKLRDKLGITRTVGPTLLNWLSMLKKPYLERCRTLVWARHLLEEKRFANKRFQSFLKKRLESPHSIDLWTYLDVPRSRIVKYPLLVKEILKYTPATDADHSPLKEASNVLSDLLKNIDRRMGDAECKLAQSKINHAKLEHDPEKCIANATELITEGQLKDTRGIKYHCFLFDTCFAITRPTRRVSKKYTLLFPVIPKEQMYVQVEDKDIAEISFKIGEFSFIMEDGHKKRHWMDSFNKIHSRCIPDKVFDTDKENLVVNNPELSVSTGVARTSISRRTSTSSINENIFSFSIRKSLLKQKRNSIGYI